LKKNNIHFQNHVTDSFQDSYTDNDNNDDSHIDTDNEHYNNKSRSNNNNKYKNSNGVRADNNDLCKNSNQTRLSYEKAFPYKLNTEMSSLYPLLNDPMPLYSYPSLSSSSYSDSSSSDDSEKFNKKNHSNIDSHHPTNLKNKRKQLSSSIHRYPQLPLPAPYNDTLSRSVSYFNIEL